VRIGNLLTDNNDEVYGPYYRVKSPSQTEEDIEQQIQKKEIWGKVPRNFLASHIPKVKAYTEWRFGEEATGIIFWTNVAPDKGGVPGKPTWSGNREGVKTEGEFAKIKVIKIYCYPELKDNSN
jgi:hypothetical protein